MQKIDLPEQDWTGSTYSSMQFKQQGSILHLQIFLRAFSVQTQSVRVEQILLYTYI